MNSNDFQGGTQFPIFPLPTYILIEAVKFICYIFSESKNKWTTWFGVWC